jgi:hypothetical protein
MLSTPIVAISVEEDPNQPVCRSVTITLRSGSPTPDRYLTHLDERRVVRLHASSMAMSTMLAWF